MGGEFYAHRRADDARQTVRAHLDGTAGYIRAFGQAIGMEEQAVYAARMHDIGKYTPSFQRRLSGGVEWVDHSTAGALEALKAGQRQVALAIAGHHAGLADMGDHSDTYQESTFCGRMKRKPGAQIEDYTAYWPGPPAAPPPLPVVDSLSDFFRTRMLFSALVDADWLDTEEFMQAGQVSRGAGEGIAQLSARLDRWLAEKGWRRPAARADMTLNEMRSHMLYTGMDRAALAPGLFSLTVPTGGGKTVTSLAFALRHALAHGLRRVIYVIPYASIIEQTAKQFREILGDDNVLEHHTQARFDPQDEVLPPERQKLKLATENWDAPVIVTTSVQFFESLFAAGKARSRKVHNVARSVVIFDEAQMLPVPRLTPCVAAIARLSRDFGVSCVLCTATQPALNEYLGRFAPELTVRELAPDIAGMSDAFRRVRIMPVGPMDDEALVRALKAHAQVLCVVNTRRHAQALHKLLGEEEGSFMLSTLLYPAHRARKLDEIRDRLEAGLPCRVVSTSLIEAGVDVDFPVVYRAMAGLDSILQAAGRCNREGRRAADASIVTVFEPEPASPQWVRPNEEAARFALRAFGDPASPGAIQKYFELLYYNKGEKGLDRDDIIGHMKNFAFRTVSGQFKLIDEGTRPVYVLIGEEARPLEHRLHAGERSRELMRALGPYAVGVHDDHFRALDAVGALEMPSEDIFLLVSPRAYDEQTGLALEPTGGEGYFS